VSYDLYVWRETTAITATRAAAKLNELDENNELDEDDVTRFEAHAAVAAFYADLLTRFPALESVPDDTLETLGVWSVTPEASDRLISMSIGWRHVAEVAPTVRTLAGEHGLICYDPQDDVVVPNVPGYVAAFSLTSENGPTVPDPDDTRIERTIAKLGRDNYFAILDRADGWYAQVGYGASAGVRPGLYAMEYREGSADRHFRAVTSDVAAAVRFMQEFLGGGDTWKRRHRWSRIEV
jgi:hypothetical protein